MDMKDLIGVTLGTCTLEQVIGHGGMGAVFLAQQSRPIRTVAVKVLIPSLSLDPDQQRIFLERFRREADTVAKLEHKNILPIYEYEEAIVEHQKLAYLVMPFIRGGTLRERIDEMKRDGTHFDLNLVASYISQVADALDYAHGMGVVHRDIKPGNLLFHLDGRLLLSDFGIVRLHAMPSLTFVGSFVGTAEYASPEQVSGGQVDARSDIYSLGIILYELLTESLPFTGPSPFAVMSKVLSDPVPSVRDIRPDLSPAIDAVVMKTVAKRPEDRYQTAAEMAADLRTAVAAAFMPASALRLAGDANNIDVTVAESALQPSMAPGGVASGGTANVLPPTDPVLSALPQGVAPWQQGARQWQWPSQVQTQGQAGQVQGTVAVGQGMPGPTNAANATSGPEVKTFHQSRRLFYYSVAIIALLLQLPVVYLLLTINRGVLFPVMGVLAGVGINLLALAAIGFVAVTRGPSSKKFFYRCLGSVLIAPIISGPIINAGGGSRSLILHLLAYIVLLLSNIFAVRQLALVDITGEQVEDAPVLWRPAMVGALTGLLPLLIILFLALIIPSMNGSLLLALFVSFFIAFIGAPTPGAMMAVWLSKKMTGAVLTRSSAIAGMLMFLGAFLVIALLSLIPSNNPLFFHRSWIALLLTAALLGLIGLLRGMLDAWIYLRATGRKRGNP
jgi:serine/threonine protein kinase